MTVLGLALGLLVGLTLGLLGAGGSVLTVPIFVYVLEIAPRQAIAMSLAVVGVTAFVGFLSHWREGNAQIRLALTFGMFAVAGALVGAQVARFVPETFQLALFGVVVATSAALMLRGAPGEAGRAPGGGGQRSWVGRLDPRSLALLGVEAFLIGVLTALVGVGGGFLIVPALVLLCKLPMSQAVGTSLLVIAMNASSAFLGYLGHVVVDWGVILPFTGVAIVGIAIGSRVVRYVPEARLKKGFGWALLAVGIYVLVRR